MKKRKYEATLFLRKKRKKSILSITLERGSWKLDIEENNDETRVFVKPVDCIREGKIWNGPVRFIEDDIRSRYADWISTMLTVSPLLHEDILRQLNRGCIPDVFFSLSSSARG